MDEVLARAIETGDVRLQGEIAPRVYAYGAQRPMGRIRAYTSASLGPFAGRGSPSEMVLHGHVHVDENGRVTAVEGFNGTEGEKWVRHAHARLLTAGALAAGAAIEPTKPLRGCPHTGIR